MFKNWSVDKLIIVSTTLLVLAEIIINFITSYGHIDILGLAYGETGLDAGLTPTGIDLFLFVLAEVNLYLARKGVTKYRWPRWTLGGGVAATVAANLAYGAHWGFTGAAIAGFSAVALFGTVEAGMLLLKVEAEERAKRAAALPSGPSAAIPFMPQIMTSEPAPVDPETAEAAQWRLDRIRDNRPPKAAPWETEAMQVVAGPSMETMERIQANLPAEGTPAPRPFAPEPEGKAPAPALNPQAWGGLNGIGLRNRGQ